MREHHKPVILSDKSLLLARAPAVGQRPDATTPILQLLVLGEVSLQHLAATVIDLMYQVHIVVEHAHDHIGLELHKQRF